MVYRVRIGQHEQGSILMVGLLALTLLTLVGVAATTNGGLESEIAKNEKSYQQAVYSAEFALTAGERVVEALQSRAALNEGTTPGHYGMNSLSFDATTYQMMKKQTGSPSGLQALNWSTTSTDTAVVATVPTGMQDWKGDRPRYTIEERGFTQDSLGKGITYGQSGFSTFNITGRGTGGGNASHVLMQVIYAKRL
jgi:Tfp pilus assembly protein PilX